MNWAAFLTRDPDPPVIRLVCLIPERYAASHESQYTVLLITRHRIKTLLYTNDIVLIRNQQEADITLE